MKMYWVNGGITPRILNLGIRWWWVVSFTSRPLYPRGEAPGAHCLGGWVGRRSGLDAVAKKKSIIAPAGKVNPGRLTRSLFLVLTELPRLHGRCGKVE
jgi:hypothetical protein